MKQEIIQIFDLVEKASRSSDFDEQRTIYDALLHALRVFTRSLEEPKYRFFMRSDSNFVNRVQALIFGSIAGSQNDLIISHFTHSRPVRIGIAISGRQGWGRLEAKPGSRSQFDTHQRHVSSAYYALCCAGAILDMDLLDDFCDAVICLDRTCIQQASALLSSGAVMLYDDTGHFDAIFTGSDITFEETRSVGNECFFKMKWTGDIPDEAVSAWSLLAARTSIRTACDAVTAAFPLDTFNNVHEEFDIPALVNLLSFGKINFPRLDDYDNGNYIMWPSFVEVDMPLPENLSNIDYLRNMAVGCTEIWQKLLKEANFRFDFNGKQETWNSIQPVGRSIGIDTAIDALLSGVPLEYVIA